MKFTKEELSEALKAKISNSGKKPLALSERSFNGKIDRLFKRLEKASDKEDLELNDVVADWVEDFQEDDNNVRNDNSQFVKKWNSDHKDGKLKPTEPNGGNDDKIDLLLKEIQTMKDEREAEKKARTISDKRVELKNLLKGKNVKNDSWIDDQLGLISIGVDTDIAQLTDKLVENYNKYRSPAPNDITPSGAGSGKKETDKVFEDIVEGLKNR